MDRRSVFKGIAAAAVAPMGAAAAIADTAEDQDRRLMPSLGNILRMYPDVASITPEVTTRQNDDGTTTSVESRLVLTFRPGSEDEGFCLRAYEVKHGPLNALPDLSESYLEIRCLDGSVVQVITDPPGS